MTNELSLKTTVDAYRYREDVGLLFNYRTGSLHRLENDVAKKMFVYARNGYSLAEITSRISNEYEVDYDAVLSDTSDYFHHIDPNNDRGDRSEFFTVDKGFDSLIKFPLRMEIELTSVCNWDCGFCYNVWKIDPNISDREVRKIIKNNPDKHLSKEVIFDIIDECHEKGCMIIRYSGGESMLHPNIMEILEYAGRRQMYQVLFTNGHFLTAEVVKKLVDYNVRSVLISLHGDAELHDELTGRNGAYRKALDAIDNCLQAGLETVVEMVLVKANQHHVIEIARNLYQRGVREFRLMRYVDTGKNGERYAVPIKEILPIMRKLDSLIHDECTDLRVGWPCGQRFCLTEEDTPISASDDTYAMKKEQLTGHCEAGLVWGSVSYDGRLRHCPHSNVYHGSLLDADLESCWEGMTEKVSAVLERRNSCSTCEAFGICKGGCHLPAFFESAASEPESLSTGSGQQKILFRKPIHL